MKCSECGSEGVAYRRAPQCLDNGTWGPLAKYIFDPRIQEMVCPGCGVIGTSYFRMSDLCAVVEWRQRAERRN